MRTFTRTAMLGGGALAAFAVSAAASAQVEVITVTAQRREATLQETPVSVAVVTGAQIEQSQIRDAADLQTLVPALRVSEFAASTNTEFALRGIGTSSFNPGLEPSVGVFLDGVYLPRTGAAINDLLSIERVEVIRGPQSTLFGRNTPAGVVSFITRGPEFDFGAEGQATVGNYGARVFSGTVTGPLVEDTLAFRLDATSNTSDGFLENTDGRQLNNRDRQQARGQLLWTPDDLTEVRFIGSWSRIDENCCAAPFIFYDPIDAASFGALGVPLLPPDPWAGQVSVGGPVNTELTTRGLSMQVDRDFGGFTLTSITAWTDYDEKQDIDADFSLLDLVERRRIEQDYDSFTQEIRLTSTGANRIDWMAGAFYYNNKLNFSNSTPIGTQAREFFEFASGLDPLVANLIGAFGLPPGSGVPTLAEAVIGLNNQFGVGTAVPLPSGAGAMPQVPAGGYFQPGDGLVFERYRYDTEAASVFGQLDFNLTDRFTLTVGGRYSTEEKSFTADVNINDPFSALSLSNLGQDLRLISPETCDPGLFPVVGGDACAFLVPTLLLQAAQAEAMAGNPAQLQQLLALGISPTTPLTAEQALNPALNPLLGFSLLQNFPPVPEFPARSRRDNNFSGNIIASFDVTDRMNIYASYSTGYKPGGFNLSYNAAFTGAFEFENETAQAFEAGMKGRIFNDSFVYSLAVFSQEIKDFQSNNFVGNGFALENAGSIEVRGLEFEGLFAPTPELVFTGGFTWLFHDKYGDYEFAPCPDDFTAGDPLFTLCEPGNERVNNFGVRASFNDLSGVDRGGSELVGALTGTYTVPVSATLEAFVRGEMTYTSEFKLNNTLDPRPFATQDSFALFNASVGLGRQDGRWGLQLWGRNLGDENYVKGGFPSVGLLGASYNVYPGDPRTYGVTLRARY